MLFKRFNETEKARLREIDKNYRQHFFARDDMSVILLILGFTLSFGSLKILLYRKDLTTESNLVFLLLGSAVTTIFFVRYLAGKINYLKSEVLRLEKDVKQLKKIVASEQKKYQEKADNGVHLRLVK